MYNLYVIDIGVGYKKLIELFWCYGKSWKVYSKIYREVDRVERKFVVLELICLVFIIS